MNRIDWDAYRRGHLPSPELNEIRERIRHEAALREEFEVFTKFQEALRKAGHSQPVPDDALRAKFFEVVGTRRRTMPRLALAGVASLAIIGMLLAWQFGRPSVSADTPLNFAKTDMVGTRQVKTLDSAMAYIRTHPQFGDAPKVDLKSPAARLTLARQGQDWACIDYILDGESVRLYMRKDDSELVGRPVTQVSGKDYVVADGVAWKSGAYSFALKGLPADRLLSLAIAARAGESAG